MKEIYERQGRKSKEACYYIKSGYPRFSNICACSRRPVTYADLFVIRDWLIEGLSVKEIAELLNRDEEHLRGILKEAYLKGRI